MFGIGFQELLLILALVLIVVGPKRLPEVAKMLGKVALEFKKATEELRNSVQVDLRTDDELTKLRDQYRKVMEIPTQAAAAVQGAVMGSPDAAPSPYPEERAAATTPEAGSPEGAAPAEGGQPSPEEPSDEDPEQPSYRREELEG